MNILSSLRFADIKETQAGIISIISILGFFEGIRTIHFASTRHFAAILKGEGCYPEKGKQRVWFKLHYVKHVYEYLKRIDAETAKHKIEKIIQAPTQQFIAQMIPASCLFTKEYMLNHVWQHLVARDYNIEGEVRPPVGNSVSLNVRRCFYHEVARDVGLLSIADRMCHGDFIFWETYHPNVTFSRTRTLIAGDDHCDHTITWVE